MSEVDWSDAERGDVLVFENGRRARVICTYFANGGLRLCAWVHSTSTMHGFQAHWSVKPHANASYRGSAGYTIVRLEKEPLRPTVDRCIWGASTPGSEPVPKQGGTYVELTDAEAHTFSSVPGSIADRFRAAHRAGWHHRRTP